MLEPPAQFWLTLAWVQFPSSVITPAYYRMLCCDAALPRAQGHRFNAFLKTQALRFMTNVGLVDILNSHLPISITFSH